MSGDLRIQTRLGPTVRIREENSAAALEVMSRFAVNPKWLIYLPPTMSPPEASRQPDLLEHPHDVFTYYQKQGVQDLVCEEKHMGSRVVIVVCRDSAAAQKRFGVTDGAAGICYTRTGRRFFEAPELERDLLQHLRTALTQTGFWNELQTDWVCLDAELMPWSAKAQDLIRQQYAPVGTAAEIALSATRDVLMRAGNRGLGVDALIDRYRERKIRVRRYRDAFHQYCWPVQNVSDLKLAPFHLLATEGAVHTDKTHLWHLETIDTFLPPQQAPCLHPTARTSVALSDPGSRAAAVTWWETLTERGGEGFVAKPLDFVASSSRNRLVQPAIKCRGREYLRIIYGPEYTAPEHLDRLRRRNVSVKRTLARNAFALGIEALERFVNREPLRRIHECVFGILALESEPVDPRL